MGRQRGSQYNVSTEGLRTYDCLGQLLFCAQRSSDATINSHWPCPRLANLLVASPIDVALTQNDHRPIFVGERSSCRVFPDSSRAVGSK